MRTKPTLPYNKTSSATAVLLLLFLSSYPLSGYSLRFHSYTNERGETVFSNVPEKCIDNGRLTCMKHHPLNTQQKPQRKPIEQLTPNTRFTTSPSPRPPSSSKRRQIGASSPSEADLFNSLDQVVDMHRLLNEYFPGAPDPATADWVAEQQDQIMGVLKLIRHSADEQELPSIERAIDIFRSNRFDR